MLLIHQIGSVRVGEIVRYTLTYTPSLDRILPPPAHLHVKVKNTSAIPLRVAYLHGPYTLYVSCAPSTFNPNEKHIRYEDEGHPDYEPQLKAGGSWSSKLKVPQHVRDDAQSGWQYDSEQRKSFTWIIEIASQVLFSTTAAVHYELLVGRDEQSVSLVPTGVLTSVSAPGRLEDHQQVRVGKNGQTRGVFTKAVKLLVEDTLTLWSTPAFPGTEGTKMAEMGPITAQEVEHQSGNGRARKRRKRVHLVVITHGLHSNLGADMLYMKESIDATANRARLDARKAREERRRKRESLAKQDLMDQANFGREAADNRTKSTPEVVTPKTDAAEANTREKDDGHEGNEVEDEDEEQVIVRGFNGNAVKTEKGIQYLGKRLAKYVLSITYPDQPYLPVKSTITQSIVRTFLDQPKSTHGEGGHPSHKGSTIVEDEKHRNHNLPYKITSISFVGHSLGGLVQTYAVAYIQKHSPGFFDTIQPINFIALSSPFLGLSNENPMYVKFALDFGLVGRTGQDLGLTWRAPTVAKNGWVAMVSGLGASEREKRPDPGTKPLLRILPTGPAHVALKRFRNRSVYSNVVNDGIVPLRTSCLLFLDWRGLGKVEKARRDNGLVGTMINWGLSEMTGQNASAPRRGFFDDLFGDSDAEKPASKTAADPASKVPAAEASQGLDAEVAESREGSDHGQFPEDHDTEAFHVSSDSQNTSIWSTLVSLFRPHAGHQKKASSLPSSKQQKAFSRGQIIVDSNSTSPKSRNGSIEMPEEDTDRPLSSGGHRKMLVRGSSLYTNDSSGGLMDAPPPRTTVFESAGDLLNPPLPPKDFILDPEARPRTIFHDRVYHPDDIPPPPIKHQRTLTRQNSSQEKLGVDQISSNPSHSPESKKQQHQHEPGSMSIEEKIARAYHKDMSWRKVLVRLEPDAHNNIIVRRQFANAYGWPVVKHLCDTHFGYTDSAKKPDDEEDNHERAKAQNENADETGEEVHEQTKAPEDDMSINNNEARAWTMSDDELTAHTSTDLKRTGRKDVRQFSNVQHLAPSTINRRTPSERREAADTISDLTSMVSATGAPSSSYSGAASGAQASLSSLNRRDSGRWSDKFFDGSDDGSDEEDEGLNSELEKAYDRGKGFKATPVQSAAHSRTPSAKSPASSHAPGNAPSAKTRPRGKSILDGEDANLPLVAEPEDLDEESDFCNKQNNEVGKEPLVEDATLSSVGLGGGLRHALAPGAQDIGVTEQVARVRSKSGGQHSIKRPQAQIVL